MATTTRRTNSTRLPTKTTRTKAALSADQLAEQFASGLTISKGKQKAPNAPSNEEIRLSAMRAVNSASQALSIVVQSGWKKSADAPLSRQAALNVNNAATSAAKNLALLRNGSPGDVDVERAAVSVLGKLIALEMFDHALSALTDLHPRLYSLYSLPPRIAEPSTLYLLSVPIPPLEFSSDPILLTLMSTYLACALTVLSYTSFTPPRTTKSEINPVVDAFSIALTATPTLLTWIPSLISLSPKHLDSILTRTYTSITRACSTCKTNGNAVFQLRMYALSCLVYTTPRAIESNIFWDQATRFAGAFLKCLGSSSEEEATQAVLSAYVDLVSRAEKRSDKESFLAGKGFIGFCEYWMAFAKKAGDLHALNQIAALVSGTSLVSSSSSSSTDISLRKNEKNEDDLAATNEVGEEQTEISSERSRQKETGNLCLEGTRVCALLAQVTTLLEQKESDDLIDRSREAIDALKRVDISTLLQHRDGEEGELRRAAGKVDRALERMRRAALKFIDRPSSNIGIPDNCRDTVGVMLENLVDTLKRSLLLSVSSDYFTRSLDTLFALARSKLNVLDPRTYVVAYDYLTKAIAILDIPVSDPSDNTIDLLNYTRCISGAFHNLAAPLYQEGKYGAAIGFLKDGCALGVKALQMRHLQELDLNIAEKGREDGWKQLEDQLYRRWELLGVCYVKIGDRKNALIAFVDCIKTFPFTKSDFVQQTKRASLDTLFASSSGIKHLITIVDRMSYLGACELLMSVEEISLKGIDIPGPEIKGALLERQIESLERHKWKESVQNIVAQLFRDTLSIYTETEMPVRRARVLLKCLDFMYHSGPDILVDIGSPEEIGAMVERLLLHENLGQDVGLAAYCTQYRAAGHLWLVLHAHRRADVDQIALISRHAEDACSILKSLISISDSEPTPKSAKKLLLKQVLSKRAPASRQRAVKKDTPPLDPVTPKRKPRKALQPISLNAAVSTPPRASGEVSQQLFVFDDFEKMLALLQSTARILGLLALVLPKMQILNLIRKFCEQNTSNLSDGYILASVDLAHEYVKLGKIRRAGTIFTSALEVVRSGKASDEVCAIFFLRFAESLAIAEDVSQSSNIYCEALAMSDRFDVEDKSMSTTQRVQIRVRQLERAAMACYVFALIQYSKEDISTSLDGMLQSLRLWNRAVETLARLNPPPSSPKPSTDSNPFEMTSVRDALPAGSSETLLQEQTEPKKIFLRRHSMDGLQWRIAEGLLGTLFALCQAYFNRGSAREAEYFAQQAQDLAESLNAPAMISRALAKKGEIQLHQGQLEEGYESLRKAGELLRDMPGIDTADVHRLQGDYNERTAQPKDAQQLYEQTASMLEELDTLFKNFDGATFGARKSTSASPPSNGTTKEALVPELLAAVLRQHIWLLRDNNGDEYTALLNKFLSLPHSSRTKAEENALLAKLSLHDVYGRFHADMFLSSLAESTIALPMGMSGKMNSETSPATQDILSTLDNAERLYWANLALISRKGNVAEVRDAALSLALIRTLQTSLGKPGRSGPILAASLLDACAGITLRRELLEAIPYKFPISASLDDLQWPLVTPNGTPLPRLSKVRRRLRMTTSNGSDDDDIDGTDDEEKSLKDYWESVRSKYNSQTMDASFLSSLSQMSGLPANWTVVHINVTEDKSTLFISRQQGDQHSPLIFCVPLKGRRDNGNGDDEEEHLSFEDATHELREIVRLSDEGTRAAVHIKGDDQATRASWWKERGELDTRMRELLENVEFCWLGAFKTILSRRSNMTPQQLSDLKVQFEKVFESNLRLPDQKVKQRTGAHKKSVSQNQGPSHVTLDNALVECFSTLSPKCRDEELEDLVYFILDLYQFHGVPVAIAEVDITQVVVDLRGVLEEHAAKTSKLDMLDLSSVDEHTFLILDKNVQGLPWESIPILRGRSVSRIPSVDFLHDRLQFAKCQRQGSEARHAVVDPRKGYYVLNPSGDLERTEGRFKDWAKEMKSAGWDGVVGKPPSEQQFLDALRRQDLVVYFGHGGGEQYVRSHKIRHLPRCAATMLWGCSSGALKEMGDFDRTGTPYNYMLAGCPTLVANLWDVTDRDIDKFSQAVFDKLGLSGEGVKRWAAKGEPGNASDDGVSVVAAVAQSRESCKLKYLTGAAPIVYGIPFYL